ncbi:hypothetical protein JCM11641_005006 [Rhodosporidiobolus odoratus]
MAALDSSPYSVYVDAVQNQVPQADDKAGLKIRLCILFGILGYLWLASLANFGVHLYSNHLKGRRLWLFRLVRRQGGQHVVSNHSVISGVAGVLATPVLIGNTVALYSAFCGSGKGIETAEIWQFTCLPIAYGFGWLLSFATFQAFLQLEGARHNSRWSVPAWLENLVFLGGLLASVGALTVFATIGGIKDAQQWRTLDSFVTTVSSAASSWDGSALSAVDTATLDAGLEKVSKDAEAFYAAAEHLAIAASVLPLILLLINGAMFSFVHSVRRQVSFQLSKLTTVQMTTYRNGEPVEHLPASPPPGTAQSSPMTSQHSPPKSQADELDSKPPLPGTTESFDHLSTFVPLAHLRRDSFSKSPGPLAKLDLSTTSPITSPTTIRFGEDPSTKQTSSRRTRPTRGKIRTMSQDPERLARDQAERLMGMMRAEQELLVTCCSVFFIATALIVWNAWAIPTLRSHRTNTWAQQEALYVTPIWFFSTGLAFAETLGAWVEWNHLRPWRSSPRPRSRSGSGSTSNSRTGTHPSSKRASHGNGALPLALEPGIATAVRVDVEVVTMNEMVELDEYEKDIGLAFGGGGDDEEKRDWSPERREDWMSRERERGRMRPQAEDVWKD